MAPTSAALQAQFDEIHACTSVLALNMLPVPSLASAADLTALARLEGKEALRAVAGVLRDASHGVAECHLCGQAGQPSSSGAQEPEQLAFVVASTLDFARKHVRIHNGGFACGRCRAVSGKVSALLQLASTAMAELQAGSDDRHRLLQELFLHLAVVNGAEAHITSNPDALAVWAQELLSRAYALQVVASSIRGWQLVGPARTPITRGSPGAALQLLQELLAETPAAEHAAQQQTGQSPALKRKRAPGQQALQPEVRQRKGSKGSAATKRMRGKQGTDDAAATAVTKHKRPRPAASSPMAPAPSDALLQSQHEPSHGVHGRAAGSNGNAAHDGNAAPPASQSSKSGKKKRLRGPVDVPSDVQQPTASAQRAAQQSTDVGARQKASQLHAPLGSGGAAVAAAQQHTPAPIRRQGNRAMTAAKAKAQRKGEGSKRRKSL